MLTEAQDRKLKFLIDHEEHLNEWEAKFINDVVDRYGDKENMYKMSSKQFTKVNDIYNQVKHKLRDEE